jgi:Nucleotidyltransferase domain.
MEKSRQAELTKRYQEALDSFLDKIKPDPNVIAVLLSGSLAYDQVWEKSDIDLTIIVRDQNLKNDSFCIVEDDITINASLIARSAFKRHLESLGGGSFGHSFYSKGKFVYSTEESLYEYFEEYKKMGRDDISFSVFYSACELIYYHDKSLKWLEVKEDPLYAQYYLLKAAEAIARMELCLNGDIPTREAIGKASKKNPGLLSAYYQEAMSHHYNTDEIRNSIKEMERYLELHLDVIKKPVVDYMSDGEVKTVTMVAKFFRVENHYVVEILEFLAEKGIIMKLSQTIRITPKSKLAVEEIAYQYVA